MMGDIAAFDPLPRQLPAHHRQRVLRVDQGIEPGGEAVGHAHRMFGLPQALCVMPQRRRGGRLLAVEGGRNQTQIRT
jgi:hypothetical protein